jgi:hypothetical protein
MKQRPEKDMRDNTRYNYYVSRVRVRSEHCVGYLKGRFCSLRQLRLRIDSGEDLEFACLWAHACIAIHSFAMDFEKTNHEEDIFFQEGMAFMQRERQPGMHGPAAVDQDEGPASGNRERELRAARAVRKSLKEILFNELGFERTRG